MSAEIPHLDAFERVVFFTGAGLSAESGIPTYRGDGGVWGRYEWQDVACRRAFERDPGRVWDWHDERRAAVAACEPNEAHRLIAALQARRPATRVVTQNVDGLHQRAGSRDVVELHGSLWRVRCESCGAAREDRSLPMDPRRCECGAWWRPDLVWFEDPLEQRVAEKAVRTIEACDCLVSVGTSGLVYPAAELPFIAMRAGALSIEINPEDTVVSDWVQLRLRASAAAALDAVWNRVLGVGGGDAEAGNGEVTG